jgi:hypothetical protein
MNEFDISVILFKILVLCAIAVNIAPRPTITGGGVDPRLKLLIINKKISEIMTLSDHPKYRKPVERFLMANAQSGDVFNFDQHSLNKFKDELKSKGIDTIIAQQIQEIIRSKQTASLSNLKKNITERYVSYELYDYKFEFTRARYNRLIGVKHVSDDIITAAVRPRGTDLVIVDNAVLIYMTLRPKSQQLAITRGEYEAYASEGVVLEAFASPFNSQVIMMETRNNYFCSLFEKYDRPFGSLGNFFALTPAKIKKIDVIVINPPFVEDILLAAAKKAVTLRRKHMRIIFRGPRWEDAAFYKYLASIKGVEVNIFEAGAHSYENCFTGEEFIAPFASVDFIFNGKPL